jgi:hypothetical protein
MTVPVELPDGQPAVLEAFDGRLLVLSSPVAFAPGAPVALRVRLGGENAPVVEGRSVGSRRLPSGAFQVRLRPVNLRREVRQGLLAALGQV